MRDDDRADTVLGEHLEQAAHLGVRGDGDNLSALTAKYVGDTHMGPPWRRYGS